ncbi:MAG: adenosine deaminase [Spirochaetia bacterium]|jgi:adenosine deaminase|nr:adenosine deaminase [Spirochaetia bacterium]
MNCELHLHLDGSLRPATVDEFLGTKSPGLDKVTDLLRVPENCPSLEACLERFELPLKVLQDHDALERVSFELVEDLVHLGLDYAEIRFAPQLHTGKGASQQAIVQAAERGVRQAMSQYPSIRVGLILCMMRGRDNHAENMETVRVAQKLQDDVVCALDLAGAESLYPTSEFMKELQCAKASGLGLTIHAGEVDDPQSLRDALSLRPDRIGHGIIAARYPDIIDTLIREEITLEVCVTSNYHTKSVASIAEHPIRFLLDHGVKVAVCADNMTVSHTDVLQELELVRQTFGLTDASMDLFRSYAEAARFLK